MIETYENHSQEDEELVAQHLISLSLQEHSKIKDELESEHSRQNTSARNMLNSLEEEYANYQFNQQIMGNSSVVIQDSSDLD